jgi:preprotein translocase subunit SecA
VEYKKEAFEMFERLVNQIDYEVVRKIFRIQVVSQPQTISLENSTEKRGSAPLPNGKTNFSEEEERPKTRPIVSGQKVGRNDPCPCGSGKKYKKCCYPKYG